MADMKLSDQLRDVAAVREKASASEHAPKMLHVVADLSRADAALMIRAADALDEAERTVDALERTGTAVFYRLPQSALACTFVERLDRARATLAKIRGE